MRKAGGYGHNILGYDRVLEKGFLGIKREAEERLAGYCMNGCPNSKR